MENERLAVCKRCAFEFKTQLEQDRDRHISPDACLAEATAAYEQAEAELAAVKARLAKYETV